MKIDNSNKRVSNVIAGILVVFVAFVFIALALGVVGNHLYIQNRMDPLKRECNLVEVSSDLSLSGDIGKTDFVSVDQDCPGGVYDTEAGYIHNIQHEFLDGTTDFDGDGTVENWDIFSTPEGGDAFVFPLCFDPSYDTKVDVYLSNWYKVFEVCGGYSPKPCSSYFNIYQYKSTGYDEIGILNPDGITYAEWVGWKLTFVSLSKQDVIDIQDGSGFLLLSGHAPIDLSGINTDDDCCCVHYEVAIIDSSCNNGACVESNQLPDVPGCEVDPCGTSGDLGKELTAWLNMTWTGCGSSTQDFDIILVQIYRIPNSRINM
jgi:hypothetical protein